MKTWDRATRSSSRGSPHTTEESRQTSFRNYEELERYYTAAPRSTPSSARFLTRSERRRHPYILHDPRFADK